MPSCAHADCMRYSCSNGAGSCWRACGSQPEPLRYRPALRSSPSYPRHPFASQTAAQDWVDGLVHCYNTLHCHGAIRFVTPHPRHSGHDRDLMARRPQLSYSARTSHPERRSGTTRDWPPSQPSPQPRPTGRYPNTAITTDDSCLDTYGPVQTAGQSIPVERPARIAWSRVANPPVPASESHSQVPERVGASASSSAAYLASVRYTSF